MAEKVLSGQDIGWILSEYRKKGITDDVIEIAKRDLESGVSKDQISFYMVSGFDKDKVEAYSYAIHKCVPDSILKKMRKFDKYQLRLVANEYDAGMDEESIIKIVSKEVSAYAMESMFSKIRRQMTQTKVKEPEPEIQISDDQTAGNGTESNAENNTNEKSEHDAGGTVQNESDSDMNGSKTEDNDNGDKKAGEENVKDGNTANGTLVNVIRIEEVGAILNGIAEGFSKTIMEAIRPNQEYMGELTKALVNMSNTSNKEAEAGLNSMIDQLDRRVKDLSRDLSDSGKVIADKESEITRLKKEMEQMKKDYENGYIAGNVQAGGSMNGSAVKQPHENVNNQVKMQAGNSSAVDCRVLVKDSDGTTRSINVERVEKRNGKGISNVAAKLFGTTPMKRSLLTYLIGGKLNPDQLKQIKYALEKGLTDAEIKDLIESGLPAEEMAGIVDIVAAEHANDNR